VTPQIAYVLALLVVATVLFAVEVIGVDLVGLLILLALALPGLITPAEALAGFGSDTIVVLVTLFMLANGVSRTGVVERIGLRLAALGARSATLLIKVLLIGTTAVSAVLSNMVTTAVFVPLAIGAARRAKVSPSRVLMPLAFASIISSGVTIVSTSTNLVVAGQMPKYGMAPLGFFELAPVGLLVAVFGMLYLLFVAPRLIPVRGEGDLGSRYGLRRYSSEIVVTPNSKLAGTKLGESQLNDTMELHVVGIRRDGERHDSPLRNWVLQDGDVLLVEGNAEQILSVKDATGVEIKPEFKLADPDIKSGDVQMVEAMVVPKSPLTGRTLKALRVRESLGLTVLGIHSPGLHGRFEVFGARAGAVKGRFEQLGQLGPFGAFSPFRPGKRRSAPKTRPLGRQPLREGDVLLLQGRPKDIEALDPNALLVLEDKSAHHPHSRKAPRAALIFALTLILGATGLVPLPIAFLTGVALLIVTRCMTTQEAYASVDWRLIVLVGTMMAFGTAMEKSGAASFLSDNLVGWLSPWGSRALMAGFFILTLLLTQTMSNQAAALVLMPVAVEAARGMGTDPRQLVIAVTFAASCSFLTPLEPSCLLVYGPGRYRFFDFFKVGLWLTLIVFVISMLFIPIWWPETTA
jgi:di/tricarboxylate transporter